MKNVKHDMFHDKGPIEYTTENSDVDEQDLDIR